MQDSRVGEVLALADSKLKANGKLEQRRGKGGQALSLFRSTTTKMPRSGTAGTAREVPRDVPRAAGRVDLRGVIILDGCAVADGSFKSGLAAMARGARRSRGLPERVLGSSAGTRRGALARHSAQCLGVVRTLICERWVHVTTFRRYCSKRRSCPSQCHAFGSVPCKGTRTNAVPMHSAQCLANAIGSVPVGSSHVDCLGNQRANHPKCVPPYRGSPIHFPLGSGAAANPPPSVSSCSGLSYVLPGQARGR